MGVYCGVRQTSETMSTPETSEHGGIASQYIYFRTVRSSKMLHDLLNWFLGHLRREKCALYLISAQSSHARPNQMYKS